MAQLFAFVPVAVLGESLSMRKKPPVGPEA